MIDASVKALTCMREYLDPQAALLSGGLKIFMLQYAVIVTMRRIYIQ